MCKNANVHAHKVQKKNRNRGKEKSTQHHKKIENEYATKTKQMISFVLIYYKCSARAREWQASASVDPERFIIALLNWLCILMEKKEKARFQF